MFPYCIVHFSRKINLRNVGNLVLDEWLLALLGHVSIWDLYKASDGLLEKAPMGIFLKLCAVICREITLPGPSGTSWSPLPPGWFFASHVLPSSWIMLVTTNQSYLLHTQILDLWNIWVAVFKVKYFTVSLYICTVLLSYCLFLSFFFIFTIFFSDKNIHLRVSWFVITALIWIHMITKVYVIGDTVLK